MGSKKKQAKQQVIPDRSVAKVENPDKFYHMYPAWRFCGYDEKLWSIYSHDNNEVFWSVIVPFLRQMETQSWGEILIINKNHNHAIDIAGLNPVAQKRLAELRIETESVISLRINGTHRLYGLMINGGFNILWYDNNHGDNATCVCRSHLKHT